MGADCKSVGLAYEGSNPSPATPWYERPPTAWSGAVPHHPTVGARALARRAILARLFDAPASLRFGLPPDDAGLERLDAALRGIAP